MKKILVIIICIINSPILFGQNDALYLLIEKPIFGHICNGVIETGFIVNSKDNKFVCDYYQFGINTFNGWNENGEDVFLSLKELRKEIDIDTIKYETISSLSNDIEWWDLHNKLSLKKKIFLLEKRETKFNSSTNKFDFKYFIVPMLYEGTRKNIVPTDLSINKG